MNQYFKVVERKGFAPNGRPVTYRLLTDATGSIWAAGYRIQYMKQMASVLTAKYEAELKKRGTVA